MTAALPWASAVVGIMFLSNQAEKTASLLAAARPSVLAPIVLFRLATELPHQ